MARVPAGLWKNLIAVQVYGANTGVGKTVFSTLLGSHLKRRVSKEKWPVHYIKPVSTGPLGEADGRCVLIDQMYCTFEIDRPTDISNGTLVCQYTPSASSTRQ